MMTVFLSGCTIPLSKIYTHRYLLHNSVLL